MNEPEKQTINPESIIAPEQESARACECVRVIGQKELLEMSGQESGPEATALNEQLNACQESLEKWKEKAMRSAADFENFKRRTESEKETWARVAQMAVVRDMLTIVDDFDRAFAEPTIEPSPELAAWLSGFELIRGSCDKMLKKWMVTEIVAHNRFDPALHEAIMQVDAPGHESGEIVQVLQKGFMFKDQVLRPAKVSVAK